MSKPGRRYTPEFRRQMVDLETGQLINLADDRISTFDCGRLPVEVDAPLQQPTPFRHTRELAGLTRLAVCIEQAAPLMSAAFAVAGVIAGIERVVRPFTQSKAGAWPTLQFPLERDPNLAVAPIDALRAGDVTGVEHAARAYLSLVASTSVVGALSTKCAH